MKKYLIVLSFIIACVALPHDAGATAKITKEKVFPTKTVVDTYAATVSHSNTMALYMVSFSLTAFGTDVFVPAVAERVKDDATTGNAGVEFGIYDGDEKAATKGLVASLLYSTSTPVDGAYKIPLNTSRTFTLIAIYDNKNAVADVYHMRIKGIRYMLDNIDGTDILEIYGIKRQKTKELSLES